MAHKPKKSKTKYHLTISPDKTAVLLRLPNKAITQIDRMAKKLKVKRSVVIYRIIGAQPELADAMAPVILETAQEV